jgi:Ca-activated chloride channel homolog
MSFIWPVMLFSLLLIPPLAVIYLRVHQRRRKAIARIGNFGLSQAGAGRQPGLRRYLPPVLFVVGLAILAVSLARPQAVVILPRVAGTVILAFDVSGSMSADDVKPTRMEAAKTAARTFVERQPLTVQIGVVAFSEGGFSVQVPTNDKDAILASIDRLAPQRGTSLSYGILASLNTIDAMQKKQNTSYYSNVTPTPSPTPIPMPKGTYSPAVVVLLTDGENNIPPDPLIEAQTAADRGVRIYAVGIGSPAGATLKVNGFTVHTQLDEVMLKQIAQLTDGAYYNAQNEDDMSAVYNNIGAQLIVKPEQTEVTAMFAGASILALLIGAAFQLLWFGRVP